jgi:tetratricopeptide (TPR) repeat protein
MSKLLKLLSLWHTMRHACFAVTAIIAAANWSLGAAQADTTTSGACSPVVVARGGVVSFDIKCPTNITTKFIYQLDGSITSSLAHQYDMTNEAIENFFKRVNEENVPPYLVAKRLESLAAELKRLRSELAQVSTSDASRALWQQAVLALETGNIDQAISLHKELLKLSSNDRERAFSTILDGAKVQQSLGELYVLIYKFDPAIDAFTSALQDLPAKYPIEIAVLKTRLADAMYVGNKDKQKTLKASQDAVSAGAEIKSYNEENFLEALGTNLRALLNVDDKQGALKLFDNRILPLLQDDKLGGSVWGVFCFSCIGGALIDLHDYRGAIAVLNRGLEFAKRQIVPDRDGLASIYINLSVAYSGVDDQVKRRASLLEAKRLLTEAFPDERHPDFVQIYINLGRAATDEDGKENAYERAFNISTQIYPFNYQVYRDNLGDILENDAIALEPGNNKKAGPSTLGGFEPSPGFYEKLYRLQIANATTFTDGSNEELAQASNDFAQVLLATHHVAESIRYFQRTITLYSADQIGKNLGDAQYNVAFIMLRGRIGTDAEIEKYLLAGLKTYNQFGNMSESSCDSRKALVDFYVSRSRRKDALQLITGFRASISVEPLPAAVSAHIAELRRMAGLSPN